MIIDVTVSLLLVSKVIDKGKKTLVDMTWPRKGLMRDLAKEKNVPFVKLTPTNWQFYRAADNYIESMQGADVALIYESEKGIYICVNFQLCFD